MNTILKSVGVGACVAMVVLGGFFAYKFFFGESGYEVPPPGEQYTNEEHRFSILMPQGFGVRETDNSIVVEDKDGNGIQIVITQLGEDIKILDEARIRADLPDLLIEQPQMVAVGGGNTGLAFKSNNPAFGGASREVWFVKNSNLYQIVTYDRLQPLLSAVFSTFTFF